MYFTCKQLFNVCRQRFMWIVLHRSATVYGDALPATYRLEVGLKKLRLNSSISVSTYFTIIASEFLLSDIHTFACYEPYCAQRPVRKNRMCLYSRLKIISKRQPVITLLRKHVFHKLYPLPKYMYPTNKVFISSSVE